MSKKGRPYATLPKNYTPSFPVGSTVRATRSRRYLIADDIYVVAGVHLDKHDETVQIYSLIHVKTDTKVYRIPIRRGDRRALLRLFS